LETRNKKSNRDEVFTAR